MYVAVEPSVTGTLDFDSVMPRVSLSVTAAVSPGRAVRLPYRASVLVTLCAMVAVLWRPSSSSAAVTFTVFALLVGSHGGSVSLGGVKVSVVWLPVVTSSVSAVTVPSLSTDTVMVTSCVGAWLRVTV